MAATASTRRRKSKKIPVVEEDDAFISVSEEHTETVSSEQKLRTTGAEKSLNEEGDPQRRTEVKRKIPKGNVSRENVEVCNKPEKRMTSSADETACTANRKRKTLTSCQSSPSKRTTRMTDGFCLYVGNLNSFQTSEEIRRSLAEYLMTRGLLFQDIRLDRSRKHAFVDMASEMDLTKALTLNGEMIHEKPMKIARAKVEGDKKVKQRDPQLGKKVKDGRCLFLKNVPYHATKEDILRVFSKAVAVRFPGGAESPDRGCAFVEFKSKSIAKNVLEKKRRVKLQGRDVTVDRVGERSVSQAAADSKFTRAAPPPNNILFVSNLPKNVREQHLKKVFKKAVQISIPQVKDRPKRYAFVSFATVADAEEAIQSSKDVKILKQTARVEICRKRPRPENTEVSLKTLFLVGLAAKTTAETLRGAFEGAISARVAVQKDTGASKRFGFVDFESEESCKVAKDAMEDCEIDGSKVTVEFALSRGERGHAGAGSVGSASS